MEKKKSDFGWKFKNSLFFIFSFIPFLQWIPFFIMNGKIPKKRWLLLGFANILLIAVVVGVPQLGDVYRENNRPERPANEPKRVDYAGEYPSLSDYFEEDYWDIENYSETEEYKQYEEDLDAYYETDGYKAYEKALNEWTETSEYKAYEEENERVMRVRSSCSTAGGVLGYVGWLVFMILGFFVERYKYLRALEINKNRGNIYGQLSKRTDMDDQPVLTQQLAKPEIPISAKEVEPVETIQKPVIESVPAAVVKININSATEEQLMTLPGMKTIDAKKIISYRDANGEFKNSDEFFDSFEAKPHMIVKMSKVITIDNKDDEPATTAEKAHETKRRFDL